MEQTTKEEERAAVMDALITAENKEKPSCNELFEDVYDELTPNLERQWAELKAHMEKYPDNYVNDGH